MPISARAASAALLFVTACSGDLWRPTEARPNSSDLAFATVQASNPSSTWEIPLADIGLSVKSDHQFPDASSTYSLYTPGVCSFTSTMFTTGSGDDTFGFNYAKPGKCGRTWTVTYSDGFSETLAYGGGLQVLENGTFSIPIGSSTHRHFRFAAGTGPSGNPTASRCSQGLVFGPNGNNPAPGSDSIVVTRIDARTWDVHSDDAPNDRAYCIDNATLYEVRIAFRIVASQPLP